MKKFKYSIKEIAEIMNVLDKNGVKMHFQKFDDFYKAMEDIAPIIHESYDSWKSKQKYSVKPFKESSFLRGA